MFPKLYYYLRRGLLINETMYRLKNLQDIRRPWRSKPIICQHCPTQISRFLRFVPFYRNNFVPRAQTKLCGPFEFELSEDYRIRVQGISNEVFKKKNSYMCGQLELVDK